MESKKVYFFVEGDFYFFATGDISEEGEGPIKSFTLKDIQVDPVVSEILTEKQKT